MALISTVRVLLDKSLCGSAGQDCVDWAIGLLEDGRDGYYLTRLAGMLPPHNHFEISDLRDKVLIELGFSDMSTEAATTAYAVELLQKTIDDDTRLVRSIETLAGLFIANDYQHEIQDFYLLHYAYEDLKLDEVQWYWKGADRSNIVGVIRDRARAFLSAQTCAKQKS